MNWTNIKRAAIGLTTAGLAYLGLNELKDQISKPETSSTEVCVVDKAGTRAQIVNSKTLNPTATMSEADLGRINGEATGKLFTRNEDGSGWKYNGDGLKVGIDLCTQFKIGDSQTSPTYFQRAKGLDLDEVVNANPASSPHDKPKYSAVTDALNGKIPQSVIAPDTTEQPMARPSAPKM